MRNYVLLAISLLFMTNVFAQESDYNPYRSYRYLGVEGIYNCTLMDLDANNYRDGGGFSFSGFKDITSNRNPLVLQWGAEGLFAVSGRQYRTYSISDPFVDRVSDPSNVTLGLNGLLRLEYRKYAVHPYIDGFVGGRLFSSGYTDNGEDFTEEDYYRTMTTTGRFAYGVGAGVFVPVSNRLDLNFRTAYTHTPEMYYINMNDFIDNTRNTLAPLAESEYDMLSFHVGIRYRFEQKSKEERRREKQERRERRKTDCCDDYYNDRCCDKPSRQRRRSVLGSILLNGGWGGPVICTPPPTDCPADSYPNRSRSNDDDDDRRSNPFFDEDDDDDDRNTCPPTYESTPYTPPSNNSEPDRTTNTSTNTNTNTNTSTNTCPPTYDNTPSRPQPSYSPRPSKGTRTSASGGSTRSGSSPNRSVRSGKGGKGN